MEEVKFVHIAVVYSPSSPKTTYRQNALMQIKSFSIESLNVLSGITPNLMIGSIYDHDPSYITDNVLLELSQDSCDDPD